MKKSEISELKNSNRERLRLQRKQLTQIRNSLRLLTLSSTLSKKERTLSRQRPKRETPQLLPLLVALVK